MGWSDPTHHFGHGTVGKGGVAPAQHGVLPASKLVVRAMRNLYAPNNFRSPIR